MYDTILLTLDNSPADRAIIEHVEAARGDHAQPRGAPARCDRRSRSMERARCRGRRGREKSGLPQECALGVRSSGCPSNLRSLPTAIR